MDYEIIDANDVWTCLGNEETVIACILYGNDLPPSVITLNEFTINSVIEVINCINVVFLRQINKEV